MFRGGRPNPSTLVTLAVASVACLMGAFVSRAASDISLLFVFVPIAVCTLTLIVRRSAKSNRFDWAEADRRPGPFQITTLIFLCLGVITSSWNGLRAGEGLALCDVFLVLAAVFWMTSTVFDRSSVVVLPRWLVFPAYVLLADVLLSTVLVIGASTNSLLFGVRFVVALLLTPLVIGVIAGNLGVLWLVVDCWLLSAGVNAAVAVSDYFAHTHIGQSLTGDTNLIRVAGLTTQPNHLGFVCVFALPILLARLLQTRPRSLKVLYIGIMILAALGLLVSGSRGGVIGGVFVFASAPFFQSAIRGRAIKVLAVGLVGAALVAVFIPSTVSTISIQRLVGTPSAQTGAGVEGSDIKRASKREEAIAEFNSSPIYGVGFDIVRATESIYLQLLSAGGLIALFAWLAFAGGAILSSFRLARMTRAPPELRGLAGAVCGTLVAWVLMGIVENQLYDRYLFVPCGLFIGCLVVGLRARSHRYSGERRIARAYSNRKRASCNGRLVYS